MSDHDDWQFRLRHISEALDDIFEYTKDIDAECYYESPSDKLFAVVKRAFRARFYLPELRDWAASNWLWLFLGFLAFLNFFVFTPTKRSSTDCHSAFSGYMSGIDC